MTVPKSHPRYKSLLVRERMVEAYKKGILATEGLIAHGRGESFDYLLGERTIPPADRAEKAAAAMLLTSETPTLSVNGNAAVLAGEAMVRLAETVPCRIEVNLFYRTEERVSKIVDMLSEFTDIPILGKKATARIPGLDQPRGLCEKDGIFSADTVLVALEDGDRTEALINAGKRVIAIDLNPLCRTSQMATLTIVDEITRALPNVIRYVKQLKSDASLSQGILASFDNGENLKQVMEHIKNRLPGHPG